MLKLLTICLFTASFLSTLTACDGYPKSELRYLDTSPTLRGDDEDENGVRDDLDIYINTTPLTDIQKIALSQYAESLQSSLLINTSDKIAAKVAVEAEMRALSCIYEKIPYEERQSTNVVREIFGATFNTSPRRKAHQALGKTLDGSVIQPPNEDVCDQ